MNQQRNFILFIVLSLVIFIGWFWVQEQIWPRPKKKDEPVAKKKDDKKPEEKKKVEPPPRFVTWDELSERSKEIALRLSLPGLTPLNVAASLFPYDVKKPATPPEAPPETIVIGGPKSHLQAVLTTRGGGVQKLTLNRFQAANWLGKPEEGKLELIQEDAIVPSYLMYHYPDPEPADDDPSPVLTLGDHSWKLESSKKDETTGEVSEVRFSTHVPDPKFQQVRIVKTYRLEPQTYHLSLLLEFMNERQGDGAALKFRYQMAGARGLPIEGEWYTATHRDSLIGIVDNGNDLWRTKEESFKISHKNGGDKVNRGESFLQYAITANQYFGSGFVTDDKQPPGGSKNFIAWARPTQESQELPGKIIGVDEDRIEIAHGNQIVGYRMLPRTQRHLKEAKILSGAKVVVSFYRAPSSGQRVATWIRPGNTPRGFFDDITMRVVSESFTLNPGEKVSHRLMLYNGPVKTMLLSQYHGDEAVPDELVDRYTYKLHLNTLTDYRSAGFFGDFAQFIRFTDLLIAVTKLMHWLFYWLHYLTFGSWGLSIFLLTAVVRGLMFPISRRQAYFSVKMQELAPEMRKIKEKYPNDRRAQSEAMMELYRKHGVSPLGGCLPLFMQLPIFLGLYYCLQESIHFRLAGFLWIRNLAAPDMLFWMSESIPWISEPDNLGGLFYLGPYFNLLPIIAVVLMVVQQKMMMPPPQDEQQEMQQKVMKYMMIFIGVLFYKVASGLCIYFISSSVWGLIERRYLPKKPAYLVDAPVAPIPGKPGPYGKGKGAKGKKDDKTKKPEESNGTLKKLKDWWAEVLKQAQKK